MNSYIFELIKLWKNVPFSNNFCCAANKAERREGGVRFGKKIMTLDSDNVYI